MTAPDEVAALVKRLRAEQQAFAQAASLGLNGNMPIAYAILANLLGQAADALESLSPPAGMVKEAERLLRAARSAFVDWRSTEDSVEGDRQFLDKVNKIIAEIDINLSSIESKESAAITEFIKSQKPMDADMAYAARKICDELIRNAPPAPTVQSELPDV